MEGHGGAQQHVVQRGQGVFLQVCWPRVPAVLQGPPSQRSAAPAFGWWCSSLVSVWGWPFFLTPSPACQGQPVFIGILQELPASLSRPCWPAIARPFPGLASLCMLVFHNWASQTFCPLLGLAIFRLQQSLPTSSIKCICVGGEIPLPASNCSVQPGRGVCSAGGAETSPCTEL